MNLAKDLINWILNMISRLKSLFNKLDSEKMRFWKLFIKYLIYDIKSTKNRYIRLIETGVIKPFISETD